MPVRGFARSLRPVMELTVFEEMVGNLASLTFGVASPGRGLNELKSTSSRTNGGKGRLSKMLSLNARDRSLKAMHLLISRN